MLGGLLGGFVVARHGLKFWLWPMLLAIHLPDAVFIWLAYTQPENIFAIGAGVAIEQFGYGFGFTAFMLYMIYIARGEHQTAHYAICTGFMALGMMLPGMWSGWLQEHLGYPHFFVWVLLATIPSFILISVARNWSKAGKWFPRAHWMFFLGVRSTDFGKTFCFSGCSPGKACLCFGRFSAIRGCWRTVTPRR
jgi:PAT family beta-lactamase induction signal transducer AmpG